MKKILISPFSKKLRKAKPSDPDKNNPKNYPYWEAVVKGLKQKGYHIIQVGVAGEGMIGADEVKHNLPWKDLKALLLESDVWISVDNFFNHFATFYKKKGVVLFGPSDPKIFGYEQNINLLKDRACLRPNQFELWEQWEFRADVFVEPTAVIEAVQKIA